MKELRKLIIVPLEHHQQLMIITKKDPLKSFRVMFAKAGYKNTTPTIGRRV